MQIKRENLERLSVLLYVQLATENTDATEILGVTRPRGAVVKCFHFLFFQEGKGESEQIGLGLANVWGTGAAPSFLVPGLT